MKLDVEGKARLLFAVVAIGGSLAVGAWLLASSRDDRYYALVTHDPVSGLIATSPVEYHGVDVGEVTKVELIDGGTVRVVLRVRRAAPVTHATVATITSRGVATRGFTGYVYISLDDASRDFRPLAAARGAPYPEIPTLPARSDTLDVAMHDLQLNVRKATALVTDVLDPDTVAKLEETTADLDRATRSLQAALDPKTVASLRQSVSNLALVTKTLADNNDRLVALLANGEAATRRVRPLLDTSRDTMQAMQTQILPEAQRALSRLERLSSSLEAFAAKLQRDPSVLVRGEAPPPPGPGEGR